MKMKCDASDNVLVRGSRAMTERATTVLGNNLLVFTESKTALELPKENLAVLVLFFSTYRHFWTISRYFGHTLSTLLLIS